MIEQLKYVKMVGIILVCILALILLLRGCDANREYNILKGKFSALKEEAEKEKQASEKAISEQNEKMAYA